MIKMKIEHYNSDRLHIWEIHYKKHCDMFHLKYGVDLYEWALPFSIHSLKGLSCVTISFLCFWFQYNFYKVDMEEE